MRASDAVRKLFKRCGLVLAALLWVSACYANAPFLSTGSGLLNTGIGPLSISAAPVTLNPLGMNTIALAYSSPELPFLNIVKSGGQQSGLFGYEPWLTYNAGSDTGEEAYLQLDSDQNVTSMVASPTPGGGQHYTSVEMHLNLGVPTAPGVTYPYAAASTLYRLQDTAKSGGACTWVITGDGSATISPTSGATASTTFTVATPSSTGLTLSETSITSPGCDAPSVVENAYASAYDAGAIFHPKFLAALANISIVRPMQWLMNGGEDLILNQFFTTTLSAGATSATLSSTWTWPTQTLTTWFSDGEQKTVTYTLGSATITWSGGLANNVTGTAYSTYLFSSWATRPGVNRVSYTTGMPYEVEIALANTLTADLWVNTPLWFTDADQTSLAGLVLSNLGVTQNAWPEVSNEVWNAGTYAQFHLAGALGAALWPGQPAGGSNYNYSRNYYGMRTAQMASTWQSVWGASFSRVFPVLGSQGAVTQQAVDALQCTYWASAPCSGFPIKAIAINPYIGADNSGANTPYPSQTDVNTITASGGDGGLTCFFSLMTTNVGTCGTLASIPTAGFLGDTETWITNYLSLISSSYSGLKLIGYEGGTSFLDGPGNLPTGYQTLITSAERDTRIQTPMTALLAFWAAHAGSGRNNPFVWFVDISPISQYGDFGVLESAQQTTSPLLSSPYKFQAIQGYIQ